MTRRLPSDLTSYDLLKTWAVGAMLVDHTGYYFYPEDDWLRAAGRLCVPVFFFLIGYANSRDVGPKMWGGLAILVLGNIVTGMYLFPLNILATMLFLRFAIDPVMRAATVDFERLTGLMLIILFLFIPSVKLWEYGVGGLPIAMYGWLCRHPDRRGFFTPLGTLVFGAVALGVYAFEESILFGFDRLQTLMVALGSFALFGVMSVFRPATFPGITAALPGPVTGLIRFVGRYSLEIYVVHLLVFKVAALALGDARFGLFNVTLFPHP
ncbi:MAG TPA: TraX family protein [Alphaproteobacteria bacterium]|nr:TraX family protein [Alphaproteobacteria bacterium]